MSKLLNARQWHLWVGIILSLPMIIVGITAFFIAHEHDLGLDKVPVNATWLPGYQAEMKHGPELKSSFVSSTGERFLGAKYGVYQVQDGKATPVAGLEMAEVRGWLERDGVLYAAAKQGLYRREAGAWSQVLAMDVWTVTARVDGQLEAVGKKMLWLSADGKNWQEDASLKPLLKSMGQGGMKEAYTLKKLNMDLHTGKAFFGKEWEVIWIDVVGLSLAFLTLTGVWVWWRRRQA